MELKNHQILVSMFSGLPNLILPACVGKMNLHELSAAVASASHIPLEMLRLTSCGGQQLSDPIELGANGEPNTLLTASLRLVGGKGGFGSMLRAQGGRMASQKTTNYEACRDLSGRRLKTVNEAKKLADYLEKEPEREAAKDERIRAKIEKGLKPPAPKKHRFDDANFFTDKDEQSEDVYNTVLEAMRSEETSKGTEGQSASSSSAKIATEKSTIEGKSASAKPTLANIWDDEISLSDESGSESESESESEVRSQAEDTPAKVATQKSTGKQPHTGQKRKKA